MTFRQISYGVPPASTWHSTSNQASAAIKGLSYLDRKVVTIGGVMILPFGRGNYAFLDKGLRP